MRRRAAAFVKLARSMRRGPFVPCMFFARMDAVDDLLACRAHTTPRTGRGRHARPRAARGRGPRSSTRARRCRALGRALPPERRRSVVALEGPQLLASTLEKRSAPRAKALLVVDMIVSITSQPGKPLAGAARPREVDARAATAGSTPRGWRGSPIVYVLDEHEHDDPDLDAWGTHAVAWHRWRRGVARARAGAAGDHIVRKPSYSAFYSTALEPLLEELGIETLVLTGCLTEIGLTATANGRDATRLRGRDSARLPSRQCRRVRDGRAHDAARDGALRSRSANASSGCATPPCRHAS